MIEHLKLTAIRADGGTQSRACINHDTVHEYIDALEAGIDLGPITVFHDGTNHWLADGFHRLEAHRKIGALEIDAEVRQGTQRNAILHSVGANQTHGLRRTNADKRRAVTRLLEDAEWGQWSDRRIAEICGVDHKTVSDVRRSVQDYVGKFPTSTRTGQDGKTYPAPPPVRAAALPDSLKPETVPTGKFVHKSTGESINLTDLEVATAENHTAATKALGEWVDHQLELLAWFAQHNTTRLKRITETQPALRSQLDQLANTYHDTIQRIEAILDPESI